MACFDTSFHRTQPPVAQAFALPRRYAGEGVYRYGFHGLSYEYIASVLPGVDSRAAAGRTIVAHLGNGASMCAMKNGHSVATTMGFSSIEGLPMGTRCGALDPGVLLYLMDRHNMDARALETVALQGVRAARRVRDFQRRPHPRWPVPIRVRPKRLTCSFIASAANWDRLPPRWADWMRSCSPAASARTPLRFAHESAATPLGSVWIWMNGPIQPVVRESVSRKVALRLGHSHQRGADDRPAHSTRARNSRCMRNTNT